MRDTLRTLALLILCVAAFAPRPALATPEAGWGRIELLRDRWGVPHVFAATDEGAMYGLGWATAEDRGFQMTWSLRIIQGRAAEVLGDRPRPGRKESVVQSDRKMRTFGFYRAARETARRLDRPTLLLLEAYSRGVNDSFAAQGKERHELFDKLGMEPEPWTPADCLASWWHLGQFFAGDGTRDLMQLRNLQRGMRPTQRPPVDDAAAVIQRADVSETWIEQVNEFARRHGLPTAPGADSAEGPKFSHAWVAGGKMTGGAAVLMSDPQTPVANPSLFYEFHIQGKTLGARGIGVPGSPALLIGWNQAVAWGLTALGADQADLFMLKTDPAHPGQYQLDGEWQKMEIARETIRIKDAPPQQLNVQLTRFGPVVSEFAFAAPQDPPVALRRIPICETDRETIQGNLAMMRATNLDEFTRALAGWRFPSANIVFGDRAGRIGFWLLGAFPLRAQGGADAGGGVAFDGSTRRNDWQGFIPHELVPHMIDPTRGWIASANHRPIAAFYPLPLGTSTGSMGDTVRSWRLHELLEGHAKMTPRDVLNVHSDMVNPARRDLARLAQHQFEKLQAPISMEGWKALYLLQPWLEDGARSDLKTPGAVLAQNLNTMFRIILTPLAAEYGGGEAGLANFLKSSRAALERNPRADLGPDAEDYLRTVLEEAWQTTCEQNGDDPNRWPQAAQAQARRRVMGYYDSLDGFGSLDPARDLKFPALDCLDGGTIRSQAAQAYSQWVPLGEADSALSLLPPGNSERPDSPGRLATMALWSQGQLHPAPLGREAVEPLAVSRRVLSNSGQ